jgi:5'-nucleotidase
MSKVLFRSLTALNMKFQKIRTGDSTYSRLVADLYCIDTAANCAMIVSGSIRADKHYPEGNLFKIGDVFDISPMDSEITMIEVTGEQLLQALENGVSKYPALEGRFPHVSNISFEFDPELPPLRRVNPDTILVGGTPLELARKYKMAMTDFVASGKDGYESFSKCKHLIDSGSRRVGRDFQMQFYSRIPSLRFTTNRRILPRILGV